MTPDEIRALLVQKHGNLMNAFRQLNASSKDPNRCSYQEYMESLPRILGNTNKLPTLLDCTRDDRMEEKEVGMEKEENNTRSSTGFCLLNLECDSYGPWSFL